MKDVTAAQITWTGAETIRQPPETGLRLYLKLKNAKLYSFWIK